MSRVLKDSGVDWIGKIPENRERTYLKYNYDFEKGKNAALYTKEYIYDNPGEYPVYSGQTENEGVMGNINTFDYDIGECLFTTTVGAKVMTLKILHNRFSLSQNCLIMKKKRENNLHFYYYLLTALFDYEKSQIPSYMQPSLRIEDLNRYSFYIPPLSEQQKIADYLDKKCSKIDLQKENYAKSIELLKEYKGNIFSDVIKDYKTNNKKLKYIIDGKLQYGANSSGTDFDINLPRYVRITDIDGDNLKDEDKLSLTEEEARDFILQDGDILFARSGATVGKTFRYKSEFGVCGFAGYLIKARFNNPELSQYVYNFTKSNLYENWKNGIFIQSTIQNIGADKYSLLQIPIPEREEDLKAINKIINHKCSRIDKVISYREKMIEKIDEYKKSLIYECVTGKKEIL